MQLKWTLFASSSSFNFNTTFLLFAQSDDVLERCCRLLASVKIKRDLIRVESFVEDTNTSIKESFVDSVECSVNENVVNFPEKVVRGFVLSYLIVKNPYFRNLQKNCFR